jgi:hypothetical protein
LHLRAHETYFFCARYGRAFGKWIKSQLPDLGPNSRATVIIKEFGPYQTVQQMTGYCMKDFGQSHFTFYSKGITNEQLDSGRAQYERIKTSFDQDRVQITKANVYKEAHGFWHRHLSPLNVSFDRVLLYMLQSGEYVPAPSWVTSGNGPMDHGRAQILWRAFHDTTSATMGMQAFMTFICAPFLVAAFLAANALHID